MLYLNQLDYRHIPYNHNVKNGGVPEERRCIATSGCGICSLCMIVDHMTTDSLTIEECISLSENSGANHKLGTDLEILAPIVADKYNLEYSFTTKKEELIHHLMVGGEAVVILTGDHDGKSGLFSHRRHYITLISTDGNKVCILDPSYKEGKFDIPDRQGRVTISEPFIYCEVDELMNEGELFHLFKRN